MTRRLRTWRSPVVLYSRQRERASSEEILLRLVLLDSDFMGTEPLEGRGMTDKACIGPGPDLLHHRFGVIASPSSRSAHASTSATAVYNASGTSSPRARPASVL